MLANGQQQMPVGLTLRHRPLSEYGDDYFQDRRHLYEAHPYPVFDEDDFYSEDDVSDGDFSDDDLYYEELIGYGHHGGYGRDYSSNDIDFTSEGSNDIMFEVNQDVQFNLQTEDNYEGRDVDIGITMPRGGSVPLTGQRGPTRRPALRAPAPTPSAPTV